MLLLKTFASERSVDSAPPCEGSYLRSVSPLYFHYASGFSTQILAYMLDSLVRVSRRVDENHFVSIANTQYECTTPVRRFTTSTDFLSRAVDAAGSGIQARRRALSNPQSSARYDQGSIRGQPKPNLASPQLSPERPN
jgi:hypothetical protein